MTQAEDQTSEQVPAEQSLRASEALYRLLAENSSDVISRHKPSGEWLYLSPAVKGLLGYEPAELIGRDPFEQIHPEDRDRASEALAALVLTGQPQTATFRIRRADGSYIWSETLGRAVLDPATGGVGELITTSRDITERIEANRKLRIREAELAHAARLSTMGQMATEIAHEMNQPLYAIANFADACLMLVQQQSPLPDANLLRWLELIGQQARRAGNVLRRITQFVKKGELHLVPLDLNELVREVLAMLDLEIRRQRAVVRLELDESAPHIAVDRILIEQVLVNLIRNAVEALAGVTEGPREITVRAGPAPEGVTVSVGDTGPGLSEAQLARVFEPYFTTKNNGIGLGLAICRQAVEAHGGRISARSGPAGGATFDFWLPIAAAVSEQPS